MKTPVISFPIDFRSRSETGPGLDEFYWDILHGIRKEIPPEELEAWENQGDIYHKEN